ncbi:hypothetical protein [Salinimicrobium oceani]|uniref:Uncharacterized protein n=1 Tax=Salinimicrobium oceani TaxID=2722702 RepID=A0ABX1D3T0_9FLAO|nr:hypothetical protein [Salinimicrobium oceani]NJW53596.1 hypothetical protein [Salinimicrobium oceani]
MKLRSEIIWAALVIVTAVVSFFIGIETGKLEIEETFNTSLEKKSDKIAALEFKVQQLSEELTSRGIFSYPQASIVSGKNKETATVLINLNGREAIDNLEIERRIRPDYTSNKTEMPQPKSTRATVGLLNAHHPVMFEVEKFENEIAIDLIFRSKEKKWHQYLRAHKNDQGEIKTFWVITNSESEVIDKHIDEGFPVDKEEHLSFGPEKELKYSEIRMNSIFRP